MDMGCARTGYKLVMLLSCLCLISTAAKADEAISPLALNARYIVAWSGITIGRINIVAREDEKTYFMQVDTKTRGLGSLISDEASVVLAEGEKDAHGNYIPRRYKARPHRQGERNITELTYNESGDIVNRLRNPDDDPAWRAPVTFKQINTARDPITASFMLRRMLFAARENPAAMVSTRTYDGARLAEMKMIRAANAKVAVMGAYKNAVNVAVVRLPIEGYTSKEIKKFNSGDPEIHLYFSDDTAFLPVRATAKVLVGELSLSMVDDNIDD